MGPETVNKVKDSEIHGNFVGRDNINVNIILFQESEREFVVTRNVNIKPVFYFTGRENELQDLRHRIEDGRKSVLVSGMGGIGKTQICRKLFDEYSDMHENEPFQHIGYIEYSGDIDSSLQRCLKFKKQNNPAQNQEAAWRELEYLAASGKLLLFVDNVNVSIGEDSNLKRLLDIPGAIVLTSRRRTFSKEFEPYRIGFLSTEKCREIYERIRFENSDTRVVEEEMPDLEYVIDTLAARHTITIEFLAHLARTNNWTVKKLREELDRNGFQLEYMDEEDKLVNIQKSYETLYDMSVLTEAEQNILEAFSIFPYIPLKAEICNQWLLADAGAGEKDYVLMKLYQKGWLQFDIEQESYALHPVFAQFIYERCNPELEKHLGLIRECQDRLKMLENGLMVECQKIVPFAESIVEKIDMRKGMERLMFIHSLARLLVKTAKFKKAKELLLELLVLCKDILGENNPITAVSYHNLAYLYEKDGEYKKAEELYKKSLRIRIKMVGEEHVDVVNIYNNLANLYNRQGEYKKAEVLCIKSLKICEKVIGEKNPTVAMNYNNLASVYKCQGKYREAEKLYHKSMPIFEKVYGEEHPNTAAVYNNLAEIYEKRMEYKKAEELYEKSTQIFEKVYGEEHSDTAIAYNNLAEIYEKRMEYKKAEELYEKSTQIFEKVYGEEHPDTAIAYDNLAGVYYYQEKYKKAEELYEKSLQVKKKVWGENHLDIAITYSNWAGVYMSQGEYAIALKYGFKAYRICVFKLGLNHPNTQLVKQNIEYAYSKWNPDGNFEQWLKEQMKE